MLGLRVMATAATRERQLIFMIRTSLERARILAPNAL
jgi:hypothetical protein